jgi:hypothetical protein
MKYLIILLTLASCNSTRNLDKYYNKEIKMGAVVEYEPSQEPTLNYNQFLMPITDKELNKILFSVWEFKQNHKQIGHIATPIYNNGDWAELFELNKIERKDIEAHAKKIGAKYVFAYEFKQAYRIVNNDTEAKIGYMKGSHRTSFVLIYFFVDKND